MRKTPALAAAGLFAGSLFGGCLLPTGVDGPQVDPTEQICSQFPTLPFCDGPAVATGGSTPDPTTDLTVDDVPNVDEDDAEVTTAAG